MANSDITQKFLKEHFEYISESGIFILVKQYTKHNTKTRLGDIVGCINNCGYIHIKINGKKFLAHRLAWLYEYGVFPTLEIDHINRCKTDNRIANLRESNREINMQNQFKIGIGTYYRSDVNRYYAKIGVAGTQIHLGSFTTQSEANLAYINAKQIYHIN